MLPLSVQVAWLFLLAIPTACIAWTVTHEEVFREPREYCVEQSTSRKSIFSRKFFYLFTCEYCFSHYVSAFMLVITGFKFLMPDWRGYLLAGFALVWVANFYISLYAMIKVDIKKERNDAMLKEKELEEKEK